ncbi:MAG: VapE family protein [Methylotenera sp.]|nr:VapE family protein [Methylotenera sp.]
MANKLVPIPYAEIGRAALSSAETLLNRWLPSGKRQGHEYKSTNPLRADNKAGSFSININTGAWGDFATNDAGNDLISLYAYLEGIEQWEAAIDIADQIAFNLPDGCRPKSKEVKERQKPVINPDDVKQAKPKEESHWHPVTPVPPNAEEAPVAHVVRGLPAMKWAYKDASGQLLGYVYRFNTSDGGKETLPLTYCKNSETNKHEWRWMQWEAPNRPIYGLDRLAAKPEAYVLLVEGEKCADAPIDLLKGVSCSWPGGSKAIEKIDWSALAGRSIYAWADCDAQREKLTKAEKEAGIDAETKPLLPEHEQPGMKAMLRIREILLALDANTKFEIIDIPKPLDKPSGWDVADAIAEGMDAISLNAFITKLRPPIVIAEAKKKASNTENGGNSAGAGEEKEVPKWRKYLLEKNHALVPCLANVYDILKNDDRWQGVFGFDELALQSVKLKPPPYWDIKGEAGDFSDVDAALISMWITRQYRFSPSPEMCNKAVETLSHSNKFHPVVDYLNGLVWDEVQRVDTWLLDFLGVPLSAYSKRVARWYLMGMVKRVMQPGCKFDYCLVLEGKQGRKKSSAFKILGGEWFGDTDIDLNHKDSMSALRGKWLYEFSELGSLARAESTKQKSFLSRQVDEFRPVFGTREIKAPRQLVFGGSTNEEEWNKDSTGGRRFWPIAVNEEIDTDGLEKTRDQLFAEALVMVNKGLRNWPTAEEQAKLFDKEQFKRGISESFIEALHEHVMGHVGEFSLYYAATEWLKLQVKDLTQPVQTRVGSALMKLGCTKIEKRTNAISRFWYLAPENSTKPLTGDHDDDVNF